MRQVIISLVLLSGIALLVSACVAPPATYTVPRSTTSDCREHCSKLGLKLGAVVIVSNMAGCVCETRQSMSSTSGGATNGGAVAIMRAKQRRQRNQ